MDTRSKILSLDQARSLTSVPCLVVGYFDPVVADHAERLAAHGSDLVISLLEPPDAILPAQARAELVAALACVRHVILGDARGIVAADEVIEEFAGDLAARDTLIARILRG